MKIATKAGESKSTEAQLRIKFISTADNNQSMLNAIDLRAQELQKKNGLIIKYSDKKENYAETLNYLTKHLECYQGLISDDKEVPLNPQMVLVFNSERRVLEFPGFPMLMKEIAEFFESGNLQQYRCVDLVTSLQRYSSIVQRWGI